MTAMLPVPRGRSAPRPRACLCVGRQQDDVKHRRRRWHARCGWAKVGHPASCNSITIRSIYVRRGVHTVPLDVLPVKCICLGYLVSDYSSPCGFVHERVWTPRSTVLPRPRSHAVNLDSIWSRLASVPRTRRYIMLACPS